MNKRLARYNIDADRILPGLYQGSRPPEGPNLSRAGFDLLVLSALEYQPRSYHFPGVYVVHAPLDDHRGYLSDEEMEIICRAAQITAEHILRGGKALVTCHAGLNRSGIITAVTVMLLTGMNKDQAIRQVQKNRAGALRNPGFVYQMKRIKPNSRRGIYVEP